MDDRLLFKLENTAYHSDPVDQGFVVDLEPPTANDELTKEEILMINQELQKFQNYEEKKFN